MRARVISIANHKGGIGKSCIAASLANACGNKGKKVLLIDYDSQSNASDLVMGQQPVFATLYNVIKDDVPIKKAIQATSYENLDLLANEPVCAGLEIRLYQNLPSNYYLLRDLLEPVINEYDLILIDNQPALNVWTIQALIASDCVIVPVDASSKHSLQGLDAAFKAIEGIAKDYNPNIRFLRGVINKVDRRTSVSKALVQQITRTWGDKLFTTTLPTCTAVQQAEMAGQTVLRYDPHSAISKRFRLLADELLTILDETSEANTRPLPEN